MNTPLRIAAALVCLFVATSADARPRSHHHTRAAPAPEMACVSDNNGRKTCSGASSGYQEAVASSQGWGGQILPHPRGCPRVAFCGCGVALKVWGKLITKGTYAVAAYWRKLPRAPAAPGMVVVFGRHHVAYIEAVDSNGNATLYDPNSGGHLTRRHVVNINRATVVNPHGAT